MKTSSSSGRSLLLSRTLLCQLRADLSPELRVLEISVDSGTIIRLTDGLKSTNGLADP